MDELDDPNPEHMSEKPTALSATTTTTDKPVTKGMFGGSLEERFVKAEESEASAEAEAAASSSEAKAVEKMVLDEPKEEEKDTDVKMDSDPPEEQKPPQSAPEGRSRRKKKAT